MLDLVIVVLGVHVLLLEITSEERGAGVVGLLGYNIAVWKSVV